MIMANDYWRKWYGKNRKRFNELTNKHKRNRRREMRKIVDARKSEPCIICKKCFPPVAMDLRHRDGEEKNFRISDAGKKIYNLQKLEQELEKCDVYCAICSLIIDRERFLDEEPLGASGIRRKKLRDLVKDIKGVKCEECGEVYPWYCIQLDHLNDDLKEGTVSHMVSSGVPEEKILIEIEKTQPICIICHRIRTSERNQYGRKDEIQEWIDKNVKKERDYSDKNTNPCFFYSAMVVALFPNLKLMKGKRDPPREGDSAHFWVEDAGGNMIDPTSFRNPDAENIEGEEILLMDNLEYVIDDPLFESIDKKEQEKVKKLLKDS